MNLNNFSKISIAVIITILLNSCGGGADPVMTMNGEKVPSGLTSQQVEKAIEDAAVYRGWTVTHANFDRIIARITESNEGKVIYAEVEIPYSTTTYSINYKDSEGLEYDPQTKTIKRYNKWVNNFNAQIQKEFTIQQGNGPSYYSNIPGAIPS